MKRKSQIEITNIMFMHMLGIIGVLTFTFLFLSLISGSSSRAEALKQESLYYNYGRRLISSKNCFAHNHVETYYDGVTFESYSRTEPGIIDVSKLFTYANQNCLKYDLVSGAIWQSPDVTYASFPVLVYEITVKDLVTNQTYNFTNDAYQVKGFDNVHKICNPEVCMSNCMVDCEELAEYARTLNYDITSSLGCKDETEIAQMALSGVRPGSNCWTEEFNEIERIVEPYEPGPGEARLNCSVPHGFEGEIEYGNVFQKDLQYSVVLRYPGSVNEFQEHPGVFNVRFCVIKIPNYCDPFYKYTTYGPYNQDIYKEDICKDMGMPLI